MINTEHALEQYRDSLYKSIIRIYFQNSHRMRSHFSRVGTVVNCMSKKFGLIAEQFRDDHCFLATYKTSVEKPCILNVTCNLLWYFVMCFRKAVRAILILIPLLGLQYVLFPLRPEKGSDLLPVYLYTSACVTSFQVRSFHNAHFNSRGLQTS